MSLFTSAGADSDAPVDENGNIKAERRNLQPYREQLATLADGKVRRLNVPTGMLIEPNISPTTGKVSNKANIGRGELELGHVRNFKAAGDEDSQGRSLRVGYQHLGVDPATGEAMTQLTLQWMPKREMSPAARAGLNRRILQAQSEAVNERNTALKAKPDDAELKAAYDMAVAKLNATKERIAKENGQAPAPAAPAAKAPAAAKK